MIFLVYYCLVTTICLIFAITHITIDIKKDLKRVRTGKYGEVTYGDIVKIILPCFIPVINCVLLVCNICSLLGEVFSFLNDFMDRPVIEKKEPRL